MVDNSTKFSTGDWVIYQGSHWRYCGWAFKVTNAWKDGSYSLSDEVWGIRLYNVRPTSVRTDVLSEN